MVYLLEQNRKFEAYMRGKVGELEARVAAQQARLAVVEGEAEESAAPSALLVDEVSPLPPEPAAAPGGDDLFAEERAALEREAEEEEAGPPSWQAMLVGMPPAADPGEAEEAAAPAEGEAALEGEGPVEDTDETDLLPPDRPATEEETAPEGEEAVEDDGAWESPLSTGRVEEWA